jgi:uracil-DNA glycosylase family 4
LYQTLHKFGFSSRPVSVAADDAFRLDNCRITNAVKCLPPDNKPVGAEINTCNHYLANELDSLPANSLVLALGGIAHRAVVKAAGGRQADFKFAHSALHDLADFRMLDSYHCSRYNTNTGRLTEAMFEQVFAQAKSLLDS